jgi:hypothetical protein
MKAHQRRRGHMTRQGLLLKHWPCLHKAIQPHLAAAPTVLKTQIKTATSQELPTAVAAQNYPHRVTRLLNMILISSLLKSFLRILLIRILLKIWRGITRDPKYKAIPKTYKYVLTDRRSQYREPQVSLIPDR